MAKVRINKFLSECGLGSRRDCEKIVEDRMININDEVVTSLSTYVITSKDIVKYQDKIIKPLVSDTIVLMMYKPKCCITTVSDEFNRKTVYDYLVGIDIPRLYPVGRLDYDTEGLLLLTNDGDLANRLTHPAKEVPKTYQVRVKGEVKEHQLAQLRKGVPIDGELTHKAWVKLVRFIEDETTLQVKITEGRNRQVRKMIEYIGKEVTFLKRIAIGELMLGGLSRGGHRILNEDEVKYLKSLG